MTLVRDDSVADAIPQDVIGDLDVYLSGRVIGPSKPHVFVFGNLNGRECLLFLSEGFSGPFSDSDAAYGSLRCDANGRPNALLLEIDAVGSPMLACERVSNDA